VVCQRWVTQTHLVGTDITGKIVWRKRLTRHALVPFMAQLPPVTIGMEACGGAHDWARQFHHQGHRVKRTGVAHGYEGYSRVEGGTGRPWRWQIKMYGPCGPC